MLTTEQRSALQAFIQADPVLSLFTPSADNAYAIADAMNVIAEPAFKVWRSDITVYEIRNVLVWSEYDVLSVSKQNAFQFLCSNGIVNATNINVRQGIASIFTGPNQAGNLSALIALAKRSATKAEKLFATGTGSDATPATMGYEGSLGYQDVRDAMGWAV